MCFFVYAESADSSNMDILNDKHISKMTNSIESLGTTASQSLVSFSDVVEDRPAAEEAGVQQTLPNEESVDREGYNAINQDSDEERNGHITDAGKGIDIPLINLNNLSATSAAKVVPKRPHYEGTQNYRKTLRLDSEQIVSNAIFVHCTRVILSYNSVYFILCRLA